MHGKLVSVGPQAEQAGGSYVTEITVVAKFLARKRITEMHFDERYVDREQCVAQRDTGMRERAGVRIVIGFDQALGGDEVPHGRIDDIV